MSARACINAAAALVLALAAVAARPAGAAWGLEQLMRELSQREHARAGFVETRYLRLLSQPLTRRGTLVYAPPDRLEKRTVAPIEEVLIVDGDRVSVEIAARGIRRSLSLRQQPALWGFVESLRATLRGDLEALRRFYSIGLDGDSGKWRMSLTPIEPRMAALIREIRIGGGDGSVRSVDIVDARGDRSQMQIWENER
jgi:hypothetical protein